MPHRDRFTVVKGLKKDEDDMMSNKKMVTEWEQ